MDQEAFEEYALAKGRGAGASAVSLTMIAEDKTWQRDRDDLMKNFSWRFDGDAR
jgi:hypothetical protein